MALTRLSDATAATILAAMWAHKVLRLMALAAPLLAVSVNSARGSNGAWPDDVPAIEPVDQRFLTQVARRTIEARLAGEPRYQVGYAPPSLAEVKCQIMVTLRDGGFARGIGTSELLPVVQAAQEAAIVALSSARGGEKGDLTSMERIQIEMQALGTLTHYSGPPNWTTPGALVDFLDPGVHGVRLFLDEEGRWFTPGEMISRGLSMTDAITMLGKEVSLDSRVLNEAKLSRFAALHWWEYDNAGHVVTLRRGMVPVALEDVSRRTLDDAIDELISYIVFRQRPDGWLVPVYDPASDRFKEDEDPVMQAGAAWALAEAAQRGHRRAREPLERALRVQQAMIVPLGQRQDAAFLATGSEQNPLALTAQYCLALAAAPQTGESAARRDQLLKAIVWLQRDDGHLLSVFPPSKNVESQERGPGMALLAAAECYRLAASADIAEAADKAFPYYRKLFAQTGSLALAPWHIGAYARMAAQLRRTDYAEFAFQLADRICDDQLRPDNFADATLWGAIANDALAPGSSTAAFVWALADAADLARQRGEAEREKRYTAAARLGARFILQLQFKPEECYYVRSPAAAIGGIRTEPTQPTLQLDSCQHALLALMKCRALLYREQP